jgi:hypothetical protein
VANQWYYARDAYRLGPFSGRELLDLAICGLVGRTDTVWKAGVEKGVLAEKVKNLFPPVQAIAIHKI